MATETNPFTYSQPLAPGDLVGRDRETAELLEGVRGGRHVWLYAPRKYGKTSLLRRALSEATTDFTPVLVDLSRAVSFADVVVRFEQAYAQALHSSLRETVEAHLQQTGLGLSLGAFGFAANLQLSPAKADPRSALQVLLDLPLRVHAHGAPAVLLALDEFPNVANVAGLDESISRHQHRSAVASYVFAGSGPGLMDHLVAERAQPLRGSALRLARLPDSEFAPYLTARFTRTGREAGEALSPLLATAGGHPQRTMLLAHHLWEQVEEGADATLGSWRAARQAALAQLGPEFDATWRRLSATQQRTLRAIIAGDGSPYRSAVLARLGLEKPAAQEAVRHLNAAGDLEAADGKQRVVDPLFGEWIRQLNDSGLADTQRER